jgi:hypothetical protein
MKKAAKIFFISLIAFAGIILIPTFVLAADLGQGYVGNSIHLSDLDPRIVAARAIQIILGFLGVIVVGLITYAGFLWMTSGGEEHKIERAKQIILNATIGLVIILASFGITTFILMKILEATDNGDEFGGGGAPVAGISGAGVIGACSVESVYPAPDQRNVPGNTAVIVTFKEEVDPTTVCGAASCSGNTALVSSVKIYKSNDEESTALTDVLVYSTDNRTFIFRPSQYLNSPSENIWYSAKFTEDISRPDGRSVFDNCPANLTWQFEVSNTIDLTPPQVRSGGVFPPPDNGRDTVSSLSSPARAVGTVTVSSQPNVYAAAAVTAVSSIGSSQVISTSDVTVDVNCEESGVLTVSVAADGQTARLAAGARNLGTGNFNGRTVDFPGLFSLTLPTADPVAGHSWTVTLSSVVLADTLTVGSMTYVFISGAPSAPNQIQRGANINQTAANIANVVDDNSLVGASATGNVVSIEATLVGLGGNNISLSSSDPVKFTLSGSSLSGGSDRSERLAIVGRRDRPMNTAIQINFNEALMPTTVTGDAAAVSNYVRVVNAEPGSGVAGAGCVEDPDCLSFDCTGGVCVNDFLAGKFMLSNQYKTLEFISDNQCGVNGCGEPIYCLPANSHLKVVLTAASLQPCTSDNDCIAKTPYNSCIATPQSGGVRVCRQDFGGNYAGSRTRSFPGADLGAMNGVMDAAFNSLDGDRNTFSEGPISEYSDNPPVYSSNSTCQSDFERIIAAVKGRRATDNTVLGVITGSFCSSCSCGTPASCQSIMTTSMSSIGLPLMRDYGGALFVFDENEDESTYGACRTDSVGSSNCGSISIPMYFCANGDNFSWEFFINNQMDTNPPVLSTISPISGATISTAGSIGGEFNKVMLSSSLSTGEGRVVNNDETIIHKNINLWSLTNRPVGYWIETEGIDDGSDGEIDRTRVIVSHSLLSDSVSYRSQFGSGIRDVYQNCYKPSNGPGCSGVNQSNPSCCNGTAASALDENGNCN